MNIKRYKNNISIYKIRVKINGGDNTMNAISLIQYKENRYSNKIKSYSLLDKILDPQKKKESDEYYKNNYEYIESDDFAKKIFRK